MHTGPVLIVDDDIDDHELTRHIFEDLQLTNELIFFPNGPALLQYLTQTKEAPLLYCVKLTFRSWMVLNCGSNYSLHRPKSSKVYPLFSGQPLLLNNKLKRHTS